MGAVFALAKQTLLAAEGGLENSPSDAGGVTRLGISQREYPHLNIPALTDDQCYLIIEQDYWNHYDLSRINDQTIANQALLLIINMNPLNAVRIIQAAVNGCGRGFINLRMDGVLGSDTFRSLNSISPYWLSDRIRTEACRYYLDLTDKEPAQRANFRGWIRRALL